MKVLLKAHNFENPAAGLEVSSDDPSPSSLEPGQVLVNLTLRPINPADIFSVLGVYPGFTVSPDGTSVPGLEGVGIVVESASSKVPTGSKVVGRPFTTVEHGQGTWQSHVIANEDDVFVIPPSSDLPDTTLAQFYVRAVFAVSHGAW
jgi:NADPH:quinone reductase-like Zn-dependent oxidoreductase